MWQIYKSLGWLYSIKAKTLFPKNVDKYFVVINLQPLDTTIMLVTTPPDSVLSGLYRNVEF